MKRKHGPQQWGSDVIVDLMRAYGFPYAAINPGSSFRGLHDSMVNYGGNKPKMLLCPHEEIAVQIAHGHAKATGKPMVAIVHDVVGLLHSCMAVYYAYIDRAPVFIIGATGPLAEAQRRPMIDWIHTANVQGEAVRAYTKWDYQPASVDTFPESFARAYGAMMTEPQGPVYMCYDAGLQEMPLDREIPLDATKGQRVPSPLAADAEALDAAAKMLVEAERPVILAEYAGARAGGFAHLIELAETVSAPVVDINSRLNFPNRHPLSLSLVDDVFVDADLVLCLDVRNWERVTSRLDSTTRVTTDVVPETCRWIDLGFADVEISSWSMDYQRFRKADLRILADTATAIPQLTSLCRDRLASGNASQQRNTDRWERVAQRHAAAREAWTKEARERWDDSPISLPRLAGELWKVIQDEDWVLTANTLRGWARRLWDFDAPHQHPGESLGTATQIGISLGVALAHKGVGRLVVDIQPDGDLMFDAGALWIAAKYEIPMLVVMFNNRAYYNDWEHQLRMARQRGTPEKRAHIGMDLYGPAPDFAMLARSMGWHGTGPIENPADLESALRGAIDAVKSGQPALVDVITQKR
jgi:thiamine pyrophosphate-dependent acetolactate synthase large subunit-like protein